MQPAPRSFGHSARPLSTPTRHEEVVERPAHADGDGQVSLYKRDRLAVIRYLRLREGARASRWAGTLAYHSRETADSGTWRSYLLTGRHTPGLPP